MSRVIVSSLSNMRDRTSEYFKTLHIFKSQLESSSSSSSSSLSSSRKVEKRANLSQSISIPEHSEFVTASKEVADEILRVTEKLEKLGQLAKRKSLFDDQTQEINKLTYLIKRDLEEVDARITALEEKSAAGTQNGRKSVQNVKNDKSILDQLKNKFRSAGQNFTSILQIRTQNLKDQNSRRKQFETVSGTKFHDRTSQSRFNRMLDSTSSSGLSTDLSISMGTSDTTSSEQMEQVSEQTLAENDQYLQSRQEAITMIEKTITEISSMYARLGNMLEEQQSVIVSIVDEAHSISDNVLMGTQNLDEVAKTQQNNTWLILKIFLVLFIFAFIFVEFIL
eukprot:TRINITY_DN473_c0_g1_i1.p1 TRINITY_DN473_c0_g1~~TRINITY_DN473_c0_g1_i1.p1  ORF type:complete len:337 (+),score=72.26 TRINITY_DN473_c0_g1_i1:25-1035(+)